MDAKRNLSVDAVALAVYLVAANPALTGIGVHEWLGLAVFVVLLVHAALHFDWIVDTVKGAAKAPSAVRLGNLLLDALSLAAFVVVTVSGLGVSGSVLASFGLYANGYYFWDPLHAISAKVLLALLVVHVVVHWKWFYNVLKKERGEKNGNDACERPDA
ncbi:DUF4405 domain-containing protein [Gordonibacter massiliensis (ex Traore et al. 2017)]|uniref:DUF4405 domain-containing protein n=1 Tax=Gordonibacter massiliensis (ex Traore et al. 2017) TaxID=1841863 RepID=UPI001C8CDA25|nr:DUF4405 domain-containing protein [Gordonibacter massiliensis (ex Traore et al. 2017)]MBX9034570.1 DUF4405 domain-containing protein [Gordonibacter massiliensis (ex Traore et al. 2017)]